FIADGQPTTSNAEISEINAHAATLLSNERLSEGLKVGLVVTSQDEQVSQIFLDAGLVSKSFSELRTQAKVLSSTPSSNGLEQIRIQFTGNLRIADAVGR
ncbi:MAG: hypothetical protein MI919_20170, partial [Holophagales bacterium]|nr:hypothetical protein [Holophagales bacterium]